MSNYDPNEGVKYAEASKRWATLGIILLLMLGAYAIYRFVDAYYGPDGVRVFGVVLGVLGIVLIVIGIGALVQFMAYRMATQHHDNILSGLVAFQREDDRGEVARTVANGVAGVLRSGNSLDRTTLQIANNMAKGQLAAFGQAQRQAGAQQTIDAEQQFWQVRPQFDDAETTDQQPTERIPPGW